MRRVALKNLTIIDILETINKRYSDKIALQIKTKEGFKGLSYIELGKRTVDVSSALIKFGIAKNERVAILSESRPEWGIAFFGIISCGGIVVPLDIKLSEKEIEFILSDSEAKCIFVSEKYLKVVDNVKSNLPNLKYVILLDDSDRDDVVLLKNLKLKEGEEKNRFIGPDDTALIVYTSGTTGVAKGVELTYKNLLFQIYSLNGVVNYTSEDNFLSILPLNHMLEITGGFISPLYVGATITYCDSLKPANIMALMQETHTTSMISVPLVLKMFYDGIIKKAEGLSNIKRKIFFILLHLSRFLLRFRIKAGRLFFGSVHKQFGGKLKCFVSGGAPLDPVVEMDFSALGFTILQGYGLTETSPVITVNSFKERKYGSVGKPLPGVELKILKAEGTFGNEGEIITRGPHIMKGYYQNPEKTSEVIKDGWLYTGDIGRLDRDGFLYITGRVRNLIVLGGGKKVFPEEVEQAMNDSPYIKEICVLGRKATEGLKKGTEEVFAVIVPDLDKFSIEERNDKEKIHEMIFNEINRLSRNLAEYKRIANFMLWFDELPKTSTKKIKRKEVVNLIEKQTIV